TDKAGHGHAAWHADGGTGLAGHGPFAVGLTVGGGGQLRLGVHIGQCLLAGPDREGQVMVEVDGGQLGGEVVEHAVGGHVVVAAHTHACQDLIVETVVDVLLGDGLVIGVVPARGGVLIPVDQSGGPGQFDDAGGGQVAGEF